MDLLKVDTEKCVKCGLCVQAKMGRNVILTAAA